MTWKSSKLAPDLSKLNGSPLNRIGTASHRCFAGAKRTVAAWVPGGSTLEPGPRNWFCTIHCRDGP